MKPFAQWTIEEVEDTFQIVPVEEGALLKEWLVPTCAILAEEQQQLDELRHKLRLDVWDWNEFELEIKFIGPLLALVDFDQERYKSFWERQLSTSFNNETLSGNVDFIVAQGRRSPKHPLFFLNEFKKERDASNDPLGQLMVAMVAAQNINDDGNPVYGAYVIGRHWYFAVLQGSEYSVSLGHNVSKDEITDVFCILKQTKTIIETLIAPE